MPWAEWGMANHGIDDKKTKTVTIRSLPKQFSEQLLNMCGFCHFRVKLESCFSCWWSLSCSAGLIPMAEPGGQMGIS